MVLNSYPANLPLLSVDSGEYIQDSNVLMEFTSGGTLIHGELWTGYGYGSLFEGGVTVWLNRAVLGLDPLLLGEIYLHMHAYESFLENDIRQLEALNFVVPQYVEGEQIILNRDIRNIGYFACEAFDQRLTVTVDE